MQTFLPHSDFVESAKALDNRRLGKQRVETLQILKALADPLYGWQHHPAVKMWRGFETNLAVYGIEICREWYERGFRDTCADKILAVAQQIGAQYQRTIPWLTQDLCRSHQSNLVRKDPAFYGPQFPHVPNDLPYVWPSNL